MPEELTGETPGRDAAERAIRVAGALAELGATRLVLHTEVGGTLVLEARRTDLPGAILGAAPGSVLECTELGLEIQIGSGSLRWRARDPAAAEAFRRAMVTS